MFVHYEKIERVRLTTDNFPKARLTITQQNHQDKMHLQCEFNYINKPDVNTETLLFQLTSDLKKFTKLNGSVELVQVGSLLDDGKVIDDKRLIS